MSCDDSNTAASVCLILGGGTASLGSKQVVQSKTVMVAHGKKVKKGALSAIYNSIRILTRQYFLHYYQFGNVLFLGDLNNEARLSAVILNVSFL